MDSRVIQSPYPVVIPLPPAFCAYQFPGVPMFINLQTKTRTIIIPWMRKHVKGLNTRNHIQSNQRMKGNSGKLLQSSRHAYSLLQHAGGPGTPYIHRSSQLCTRINTPDHHQGRIHWSRCRPMEIHSGGQTFKPQLQLRL